jgi:hypothetical protein
MRRVGVLVLAGACCVLLAGAATAKSTSGPQVIRTGGVVGGLAADAGLVAFTLGESRGDCDRIMVWEPSRRSIVRVGSRKTPCQGLSTGEWIPYVALAGRRVAWGWDGGGNFHDSVVRTASVGRPLRTTTVATRSHNADSLVGGFAGSPYGDGDLLVYGTWRVCEGAEDESSSPCPPDTPDRVPYDSEVHRIRGTRSVRIASDPGELGVLAVSTGRIAVLRSDARIAVLGATGKPVRTFPFARGDVRGATLDGRRLVVLRRSEGRHSIDAYDITNGSQVSRAIAPRGPASDRRCKWPVVSLPLCRVPYARLRLADSESGIAVYVLGREIHLVRIADGARTMVRPPTTRGAVEAQLERSGLFYAYQVADPRLPGRVAFVPYAEVVGRLR